jgi:hypothetical protein
MQWPFSLNLDSFRNKCRHERYNDERDELWRERWALFGAVYAKPDHVMFDDGAFDDSEVCALAVNHVLSLQAILVLRLKSIKIVNSL